MVKTYKSDWSVDYKEYSRFASIALSEDFKFEFEKDLYRLLKDRNSYAVENENSIDFKKLSFLLINAFGRKRNTDESFSGFRNYPSAGGLYPIEIYIYINCEFPDIKKGIYHFNVKNNSLEYMWESEHASAIYNQKDNGKCNSKVSIVFTSILNRISKKYGKGVEKFSYIETGAMMQNLSLISESLNISCSICNHNDELVIKDLDIDGVNEIPTGLVGIDFKILDEKL